MTSPADLPADVDVVVVGAGLAGLVAARDLVAAGRSVLVLEARDRVGGRSHTGEVAGVPVDLGAAFVGPTQDRVLALADALGVATVPTRDEGDNLLRWRGRLRRYRGTIPRIELATLLDLERVRRHLDAKARRVPLGRPWEAPRAARLDEQTLGSWLASVRASRGTRDLLSLVTRVTWGCDPGDVSLLHVLHYVHAAGGLDPLLDTRGGAQERHLPSGTQELALRLAAGLGDRVVLGAAVTGIAHDDAGAVVTAGGRAVRCRQVVVAVPPALRERIAFAPALPHDAAVLPRRWPQGELSKAYAAYDRPFWRDAGLSGQGLSDDGPVFITFDVSPAQPGPGVLLGFVWGRAYDGLDAAARRAAALDGFASLFGPQAREARDVVDVRWAREPWSTGGPTAATAPGGWTASGRALARPHGPVHWAGTETADRWTGFLDGAVRSGERVAREVLAR